MAKSIDNDFAQASRALHAAGSGGFRKDVEAELKKVAEQTAAHMKAAIPGGLPRSGGLAAEAASSTHLGVRVGGVGDRIEASIVVRSRYNLGRMNATGSFSHPVFGDHTNTVEQSAGVHKGFLDEPFHHGEAELRHAADDAVRSTAATIDRSVGL